MIHGESRPNPVVFLASANEREDQGYGLASSLSRGRVGMQLAAGCASLIPEPR